MIIYAFIFLNGLFSQPVDLSKEWEINNSFYLKSEIDREVRSKISKLKHITGIIFIQNGSIIFENYYNNYSKNDTNHTFSVTKSFMSALIGQAIDMDLMPKPESSLSKFFPKHELDISNDISLDNVLTMTTGYREQITLLNHKWKTTEKLLSFKSKAQGNFQYNNSACHINAHAFYHSTGFRPLEFGEKYLFPQLGVKDPKWDKGYLNINDASVGLSLRLRDMVKLGQLYLQDGLSGREVILSKDWIRKSTAAKVETNMGFIFEKILGGYDPPGYGYLWWIEDNNIFLASGYGGQYIIVVPNLNLVIGTQTSIEFSLNPFAIYGAIKLQNMILLTILNDIIPIFEYQPE